MDKETYILWREIEEAKTKEALSVEGMFSPCYKQGNHNNDVEMIVLI